MIKTRVYNKTTLVVTRGLLRFVHSGFGHGQRHAVFHRGPQVSGSGIQRPQGQETVPHRQHRLGPKRDHFEIHGQTGP